MQSISPETIYRGNSAWEKSLPQITKLTKSPLILGRGIQTNNLRNNIFNDLKNQKLNVNSANLQFDCCYEDISRVKNIISHNNNDSVIAAGGGKVLDSGKYIAESLNIPCITVPLSASTCAGWTALSNIYTKDGQFIKDVALRSCPKILVYDHKFIQTAPSRTLASGIADALAKWYESSITSSTIDDGLVQQAIQISRVLRDQLLIDGESALVGLSRNPPDLAVVDIKMPRMDGEELLKKLRKKTSMPVIFLTSKDDEIDELLGLKLGADDFIKKSGGFSIKVLIERIRVQLRKKDSKTILEENKSLISHGRLKLDPSQLECEWNGESLPDKLTTTEFLIVKELAKRPGIIKERAQLMDIAYREDTDIEDRTIDSHVKRIRKKFKKVDPEFSAIETRYGSGYRWNVS